jgi:hypothetical protein
MQGFRIVSFISAALNFLMLCVVYATAFLLLGGGWALTTVDCHFELNALGYLMLIPPLVFVAGLLWKLVRRTVFLMN